MANTDSLVEGLGARLDASAMLALTERLIATKRVHPDPSHRECARIYALTAAEMLR